MIALDYTSRIDPNAIKAAGATVVCRYIAPQAWKVIHQAEYNELKAAGIQVILNWESSANDWSGGSGAGTSHGNQASAMADALGYPKGSVIIGSCDFDANAVSVEPYAQAFKVALEAHGFKAGVYAPYNVLSMCQNHGYAFYWQTMSTGWANNSRQHPAANLWQKGHKTVGGQDCDWSQIINVNVGPSVTPTPSPLSFFGDDEMLMLACNNEGNRFWVCNGMISIEYNNNELADLRTLEAEGLVTFAKDKNGRSTLEFPRKGWSPSFGKWQPLVP